jgi:hypothetical protein
MERPGKEITGGFLRRDGKQSCSNGFISPKEIDISNWQKGN